MHVVVFECRASYIVSSLGANNCPACRAVCFIHHSAEPSAQSARYTSSLLVQHVLIQRMAIYAVSLPTHMKLPSAAHVRILYPFDRWCKDLGYMCYIAGKHSRGHKFVAKNLGLDGSSLVKVLS